jgi:MFS transporter, DHA2 family, multidrug resistance protein
MPTDPLAAKPAAAPVMDGLPAERRRWAVAAIFTALAMASLDTAIANIALPAIAADLHVSAADVVWVVNVYQIALVATLLPLGALGEIVGHQRIYLGGLVLFTLASLGCALAWSLPSLLVARALQGLGASGVMSVNTALVRFVYPSRMHGRGFGNNALVVATAFTLGPNHCLRHSGGRSLALAVRRQPAFRPDRDPDRHADVAANAARPARL